jgi:hypothetical protein
VGQGRSCIVLESSDDDGDGVCAVEDDDVHGLVAAAVAMPYLDDDAGSYSHCWMFRQKTFSID